MTNLKDVLVPVLENDFTHAFGKAIREEEINTTEKNRLYNTVEQLEAQSIFADAVTVADQALQAVLKEDRIADMNEALKAELYDTYAQVFAQSLFGSLDEALKDWDKLDYYTKGGATLKVKFIRFVGKTLVNRRPSTLGRAYIPTRNFPELVGESNPMIPKRVINLYGHTEVFTVNARHVDLEELRVEFWHKGKKRIAPIQNFGFDGTDLISLINSQPTTVGKEFTRDDVKSTEMFYHANHGLGHLVALGYNEDGTPIFVQNDEYGHPKAMFVPAFEDEAMSTLGFEVSEDEFGTGDGSLDFQTQTNEGLAGALDASQMRMVDIFELEALVESDLTDKHNVPVMDVQKQQAVSTDYSEHPLYYSLGRVIADIDDRTKVPTVTYSYTGLPELVHVVKNLPPRKYEVRGKVRNAPEVLVIGEDTKRLYVTNPSNLYAINGEENATLKELRYNWTNPIDGVTVKSDFDEVGYADFSNPEDNFENDFINNSAYEMDIPEEDIQTQVEATTKSTGKDVLVKAEHIAKHKLPIPELDYKVRLNYAPLGDGVEIATISFEKGNVTYLVRYVYSTESKAVVAKANFSVKTDTSRNMINEFKSIVATLWHKNKPNQIAKQA